MSLLFSSHLLPDVEAVCDHVLVLGRGRLLAQGAIGDLKQRRRPVFEVRLKGDPAAFAAVLGGLGCAAEPDDDRLLVDLPEGRSHDLLWRAARDAGEQIRSLRPAQHAGRGVPEGRRGTHLMPIFDQGYQHWDGPLSGHAWRWLAVTRTASGSRHAAAARSGSSPRPSSRPVLSAVLVLWGLLEQQSACSSPSWPS